MLLRYTVYPTNIYYMVCRIIWSFPSTSTHLYAANAYRHSFERYRNHIYNMFIFGTTVTATCDQEVFNNITYIVSPSFPSLMTRDIKNCTLKIKMISAEVSQLRLDFVHFSMVSALYIWITRHIIIWGV